MSDIEEKEKTIETINDEGKVLLRGARRFKLDVNGQLEMKDCPNYIKPSENVVLVNCRVGTILINEKLLAKKTYFTPFHNIFGAVMVFDPNRATKEVLKKKPLLKQYKETLQENRKIQLPTEVLDHLAVKNLDENSSLIGIGCGEFLKIYDLKTLFYDEEEFSNISRLL